MSSSEDDAIGATKRPFDQEPLLRKRLLDCPYFIDRETRMLLIEDIGWSIDDHSDEQVHTTLIIKSCLNQRRGLQKLIYRLRSYEKSSLSMRALDECMKQLFPGLTTYEQLEKLKSIFRKESWPHTILEEAYNASGLPLRSILSAPITPEQFYSLLEDLADEVQQSDGSVPLIRFVQEVAHATVKPELRANLLDWIKQVVDEQRIRQEKAIPKATQNQMQVEASAFIQIAFIPNRSGRHRPKTFIIQSWLWNNRDKQEIPLSKKTNFQWKLSELPTVLREILNDGEAQMKYHQSKPVVELFLPDELLTTDLDKWKVRVSSNSKVTQPICIAYPVAVRSLDRASEQEPNIINDWKRYWGKLEKRKSIQITIIDEDSYKQWPGETFNNLMQGALEQGQVPVFTFFPPPLSSKKAPLITGTPIAFWFRPYPSNFIETDPAKVCEDLLANKDFLNLPYLLWQERMKELGQRKLDHFVHYLTILWDDPYRIPRELKDFRLPQANIDGSLTAEDLPTGK